MSNRIHSVTPIAAADLDPASWPAEWRSDWEIKGADAQASRAWHRSGLCFFFEFEQVDEHGSWAWVVYDDDISQSRLFELQSEMGEEAFNSFSPLLGRQAKMLWQELGHGDFRLGRDPSPLEYPREDAGRPAVAGQQRRAVHLPAGDIGRRRRIWTVAGTAGPGCGSGRLTVVAPSQNQPGYPPRLYCVRLLAQPLNWQSWLSRSGPSCSAS